MSFDPGLKIGETIFNNKLREIFQCSPQGGMRRSKRTNTLVLVSNKTIGIYDDRWEGDILHYTGEGQTGNQSLTSRQNKTLNESKLNGIDVHLFEVREPQKYIYLGRAELVGSPYKEQQTDVNNNLRTVWIFPLRVDGATKAPPHTDDLDLQFSRRENEASQLEIPELLQRIRSAPKKPSSRNVTSSEYTRDPHISALVKKLARGICHLCGEPAPFVTKQGLPYLEAHHIKWLAKGGEDTLLNSVALCPNCHRRMHHLDRAADRQKLEAVARHHEENATASTR